VGGWVKGGHTEKEGSEKGGSKTPPGGDTISNPVVEDAHADFPQLKDPPEWGTTDWGECVERTNAPKTIDRLKTPAFMYNPARKTPASARKKPVGGAMSINQELLGDLRKFQAEQVRNFRVKSPTSMCDSEEEGEDDGKESELEGEEEVCVELEGKEAEVGDFQEEEEEEEEEEVKLVDLQEKEEEEEE
jgi:hypothetical protein